MNLKKWRKSIYYMSDKEIAHYYCLIYDNYKHIKEYVKTLRNKYINEVLDGKIWLIILALKK